MSNYVLFTKAFWADTAERVVSTAAQAVVAVYATDQVMPDVFHLDLKAVAGVAIGGGAAALVKALAKLGLTAPVATVEVPRPPTDEEIQAYLENVTKQNAPEGV